MANNPQFTGMQPLRPHVVNQVGHPQVPTPQSVQLRNVAPLPPPPPPPSFTPAASNMGSSTSRIQYSNVSPTQLPPPPPRGQVMAASVQPQIPSNLMPNYGGPGNNPMSFNLSDSQQVSMGSTDQHVQTWIASGNQNVPSVLSQQQIVEQGNAEQIWYSSGNDITGKNVEQSFELRQSLPAESSQKPEGLVYVGNDNLPAQNKEDSSVWKEHTRDGKTYYYNRMTKVSTWKKPFELMTPTERADSTTDWREVTAPDGRRFFYNSVLHKSKWLMPDEVKLARQLANLLPREETKTGEEVHTSAAISSASGVEAINVLVSAEPMVPHPVNSEPGSASDPPFVQEESEAKVNVTEAAASVVESETPVAVTEPCVTTSPTKISDTMSPQEAEPSSKTATGSEEEAIKSSEGSVAVGIEAQDGKKEEQGPLTYESKEDAKNAFKALLESANVGTESNWDQAMRMIINDRRYGALRSLGEKKQVFHEFVAQKKKQEAEERRVRQKKAREDFKSMLEEAGDLTSSIRWSKAISMFEKDERFQAVDRVKDREDIFEDYIEDLKKKERAKASEDYKRHKAEYLEFLKSCDFIKVSSQWRKVQHRLEADERCSRLEKIDRLEMFQEYVRELEMEEEAKRKLRTAEQRKAERRNRDDFRKLMDEHVANGTLTANTHWRDYSNKVKDAPSYVAVTSNTSGSTAKELFDDVIEDLEKQYLDDKEKIEDAMKSEKISLSKSWTLEEFKAALPSKITSKAVSDINLKIIFDELMESAKEKEEKESKKRKRLTQDIYDYLINLKDIKASSKWEEFKSLVQARFVADDSFFEEIFDKVTSDLKEKTKEKERKRKEEKSKKEKERKHKEKERKSKHQKRKRRRSDDSDSDSSDSHHLSEERRSRDRDRKHHKHRASSPDKRHYSDDEHKDLSRTHRHTATDSKRSKQAEKQSSTTEADSRKQSKRQKRDHSDGGFEKNDDHKDVQIGDEDVEVC